MADFGAEDFANAEDSVEGLPQAAKPKKKKKKVSSSSLRPSRPPYCLPVSPCITLRLTLKGM